MPKKITKYSQAKDDELYWKNVGNVLGLTLYGWTDRFKATFQYSTSENSYQLFEIPKEIADKILDLNACINELQNEFDFYTRYG